MREEYKAIVESGSSPVDDPGDRTGWDMNSPPSRISTDYKKSSIMVRIEALNHALRGLPPERIRFHLCCGPAGTARMSPKSR